MVDVTYNVVEENGGYGIYFPDFKDYIEFDEDEEPVEFSAFCESNCNTERIARKFAAIVLYDMWVDGKIDRYHDTHRGEHVVSLFDADFAEVAD